MIKITIDLWSGTIQIEGLSIVDIIIFLFTIFFLLGMSNVMI